MKNKETNKSHILEIYTRNVVIFNKRQAESAKKCSGNKYFNLVHKIIDHDFFSLYKIMDPDIKNFSG